MNIPTKKMPPRTDTRRVRLRTGESQRANGTYQYRWTTQDGVRHTIYDDFIFVNRDGNMQHQGTLNKALKRIMRDCNDEILDKHGADSNPVLLPPFSCHNLRHTFATRLCESGINVKVIQDILGHADIGTTMDIYVDVTKEIKNREIAAYESYLKEQTTSERTATA